MGSWTETGSSSLASITRDTSTLSDAREEMQSLVETIWRLRQPDGCPWDRKQTHESIGKNMIEEAYEALDCIEAGDVDRDRVVESGEHHTRHLDAFRRARGDAIPR